MSEREQYPAGVPCWVESLQPDPRAALGFYGPLFGWEFAGPGPMPGDPPGEYYVARVAGRDVAGIGSAPEPRSAGGAAWSTYIRVDSADAAAASAARAGGTLRDGPFDVLPAGRMAVLEDPAGAVVCVWEAAGREGAQLINAPRAWAMSLLETADPAASSAFYGAMFGWQAEPVAPGAPVVLWRLPGYVGGEPEQPVPRDVVGVMSTLAGSSAPMDARWRVDFWVDDADGTAERAVALGGEVVVAPHEQPMFRSAVLADPAGATFSINQRMAVPPSG